MDETATRGESTTTAKEDVPVTSLGAICADFYINQKLSLKMDLPSGRESVLDMFDRIRKEVPEMDRLRRYEGELALESPESHAQYNWLALNQTAIRSGWVNPESLGDALPLHRLILEVAPYYLSISPSTSSSSSSSSASTWRRRRNRNEIVFEALLADSPLRALVDTEHESVLEAQPLHRFSLSHRCDVQAFVEVKTRVRSPRWPRASTAAIRSVSISRSVATVRTAPSTTSSTASGRSPGTPSVWPRRRVIPGVVIPLREAIGG